MWTCQYFQSFRLHLSRQPYKLRQYCQPCRLRMSFMSCQPCRLCTSFMSCQPRRLRTSFMSCQPCRLRTSFMSCQPRRLRTSFMSCQPRRLRISFMSCQLCRLQYASSCHVMWTTCWGAGGLVVKISDPVTMGSLKLKPRPWNKFSVAAPITTYFPLNE